MGWAHHACFVFFGIRIDDARRVVGMIFISINTNTRLHASVIGCSVKELNHWIINKSGFKIRWFQSNFYQIFNTNWWRVLIGFIATSSCDTLFENDCVLGVFKILSAFRQFHPVTFRFIWLCFCDHVRQQSSNCQTYDQNIVHFLINYFRKNI